jgi:hypothetical protein
MTDEFQTQLAIADEHFDSMPPDLRSVYEAEYSAASAEYLSSG